MSPENIFDADPSSPEPSLDDQYQQRLRALDLASEQLLNARTPEEKRAADLNLSVMRGSLRDFERQHGRPYRKEEP